MFELAKEDNMKQLINIGSRTSVTAEDIVYLKAEINYTIVSLASGEKILVSYTLGKIFERLAENANFIRPNRQMVINLNFITDYNSEHLYLNHQTIQISRRRRETIQRCIEQRFKIAI